MTKHKGFIGKAFEHRTEPPLSDEHFRLRLLRYLCGALLVIFFALGMGMLGYHCLENMDWLDAFLNASMILGGMEPVTELHTAAGKFFAGCYALFSGLLFLVVAGLIFGPLVHRLLHRFHFDADSESGTDN